MNLKILFKALCCRLGRRKGSLKLLMKSYVSLFLIMSLAVGAVSAWLSQLTDVDFSSRTLSMSGAMGMRNDKDKKIIDEIQIPSSSLEEASSVDGRNLYFPISLFNNVSDSDSSSVNTVTESGVFREANAGDQNVRYAYAEASLSGSSNNTNVWIRGYTVKVGDDVYQDELQVSESLDLQTVPPSCPVRIAIISDSGDTPRIFDPSALVTDYAENTYAVNYTSRDGVPVTKRTNLESFSSYYYGTNNPLFTLDLGESKEIAVVAWLEGTHERAKYYENKKLSVDIEIETNVSDMEYVYFHDYTVNDIEDGVTSSNWKSKAAHWLSNGAIIAMSYYDESAQTYKTAVMTRMAQGAEYPGSKYKASDNYTYMATIPSSVTGNISFYRLASIDDHLDNPDSILKGNIYNAWHTKSGINSKRSTKASLTAAKGANFPNLQGYSDDDLANRNATAWCSSLYGNLQETRVIGSVRRLHYYAIRGNGYGDVPSGIGNAKYSYWLSPCVGYWGDTNGPVTA